MSGEQNIQVVQSAYSAFGRGDIPALLELMTDDIEWTLPGPAVVPIAGTYKGRDALGEFFAKLGANIEFQKFEPRQFVAEGNLVLVLGSEQGIAKATGKSFSSEWVHAMTVRDGKVSTFRAYIDTAEVAAAFDQG